MASENCTWNVTSVGASRLVSDYLKLGFYSLLLIIGAPFNLQAFRSHLIRLVKQQHQKTQVLRFILLRFNLIVANLIILLIHVPSQVAWLAVYQWHGGDTLCRVLKFFDVFGFYLSSNAIMIMALDSMVAVIRKREAPCIAFGRVRLMVIMSYIIASLFSTPQLVVWTTVVLTVVGITQCTTIWALQRWYNCINAFLGIEIVYRSLHLAFVFWVPASIAFCCYLVLLSEVVRHRRAIMRQSCDTTGVRKLTATMSISKTLKRFTSERSHFMITSSENNTSKDSIKLDDSYSKPPGENSNYPERDSPNITTKLLAPPSVDPERSSTASSSGASFRRRQARLATTLRQPIYIVTAYMLCYLPYNVIALIEIASKQTWLAGMNIVEFLEGLVVLNSVLNPFLYKFNTPT